MDESIHTFQYCEKKKRTEYNIQLHIYYVSMRSTRADACHEDVGYGGLDLYPGELASHHCNDEEIDQYIQNNSPSHSETSWTARLRNTLVDE